MSDKNYRDFEILDVTDNVTMNDVDDPDTYDTQKKVPLYEEDSSDIKVKK